MYEYSPSLNKAYSDVLALAAPRFLGCYQDSESRDLPTAVQVRPLTVEGCVSKCGESGFSIAGLQSSTQCFCGTTYSKYGRLQNDQCTMRCTGNYKEICGGVMMNSLYYTGKIRNFDSFVCSFAFAEKRRLFLRKC